VQTFKLVVRRFFALLLLSASVAAVGQSIAIDSLIELSRLQQDKDKVHTLINIAREYFIKGDTLSLKYSRQAIELSKTLGYELGVGQAILFHGLGFADIQPDSALKYYIQSSEILNKINHPWAHYGYKNAADIYNNRGWYPEALDLTIKILEINEKSGDSLLMAESMSTMGLLHYNLKDYQRALYWQNRAYDILGDKDYPVRRGFILGRIGIIYDNQSIFDSAFYYNRLALDYFKKTDDQDYTPQWMSNIANTLIKLGDYPLAEHYLDSALRYRMNDDRRPSIYNNLGKVYLETGRLEKARQMLDSAEYYANQFSHLNFLTSIWYRKYELSIREGNTEAALEHFKKYAQVKDSLLDVSKTEQLARMFALYETEQAEKAFLFEKSEKERIESERFRTQLSLNRIQKWIWGISFFALLLISHVLFFLLRIKRNAQDEKNLAVLREKERGLTNIINAQEEERRRVAKDLHDGVGQQISAISLNFQLLSSKLAKQYPEMSEESDKIKRMIMNVSSDIREVSHQMMPRALTRFGLVDALEDMAESCFANAGIGFSLKHEGMEKRLPPETETGLYRIVQELVNNIIKHADASHVGMTIFRHENTLNLEITDNGKGFDSMDFNGLGLTNIRSRISALKGSYKISSVINQGTQVSIKVNL